MIPYQVGNAHGFGEVCALGSDHCRGHNCHGCSYFHDKLERRTLHAYYGLLRLPTMGFQFYYLHFEARAGDEELLLGDNDLDHHDPSCA
jgi:hypothetical protein